MGWVMEVWRGHVGVGWGESCMGVVGYVAVVWFMQEWGGVGHAGLAWGRSCRDGVGWVMEGWMGHVGVGWGESCRGVVGYVAVG